MTDHAPYLQRAFDIDRQEGAFRLEHPTGEIPEYVRGTYYINGPARFRVGDLKYRSWLDGDGMVCALRFDGDGIHFTNRFIRNTKFVTEEREGRAVFRQFGTAFEGDRLRQGVATETPSSVSVYPFAGAVLAFGEYAIPWALDPVTLETIGQFTFDHRLNDVSPFSPHPKIDPVSGDLYNFGVSFSSTRPQLHVYRFNRDAQMVFRKRLPIDYPCAVHDFSLSGRYMLFHLSPYLLRMDGLMAGGATIDGMTWEPERGSTLRIVSRESGADLAAIPIGQRYCLHLANSFEVDGRLTVDLIEYDRPLFDQYQVVPDLFTDVSPGRPVRFVVDTQSWTVLEQRELDYCLSPDFPHIDQRQATAPTEHMWMLGISASGKQGRKFFDQLVHVDWGRSRVSDIYQAPQYQYFGGEPVFVGGEDEAGTVICHIFDAQQISSHFAFFDAYRISDGPFAKVAAPYPVHLGFHATFDRAER
jgi:all-trans-8'-apo-beta-carotenal 15,15'-oxygenase